MYYILCRVKGSGGAYRRTADGRGYNTYKKAWCAVSLRIRKSRYPSPYEYVISDGNISKQVGVI